MSVHQGSPDPLFEGGRRNFDRRENPLGTQGLVCRSEGEITMSRIKKGFGLRLLAALAAAALVASCGGGLTPALK